MWPRTRRSRTAIATAAHADPDPDLRCFELVPRPDYEGASGTVRLDHVDAPFGVAVDLYGAHRYDIRVRVACLPQPEPLGGTRYGTWATTPLLRPVIRLGDLSSGEASGVAALEKLLVRVSVDGDRPGDEWEGPIVLRVQSPANRFLPMDDPVLLMGAGSPPDPAGHAHRAPIDGWPPVPMLQEAPRRLHPVPLRLRPLHPEGLRWQRKCARFARTWTATRTSPSTCPCECGISRSGFGR